MSEESKLPPIAEDSFDGYKERVELTENRCEHRDTQVVSGSELKCLGCSARWVGASIVDLHNLLQSRLDK